MRYFAITNSEMRQLGYANSMMTVLFSLASGSLGVAIAIWAEVDRRYNIDALFTDPLGGAATFIAILLYVAGAATLLFRESTIHEILSTSVDIP